MDPKYVKGYAECMGIPLERTARSLFMTRADFERLKERVAARRPCVDATPAASG